MKIGLISDTHMPRMARRLPQAVFEHFKGADLILHAGDLTNLMVLDQLREITDNVVAVSGNMDLGENSSSLPTKTTVDAGEIKIGLMHGWGSGHDIHQLIWDLFEKNPPDVIVFGHTHKAEKTVFNGVLFVNPGSPTDDVYAESRSVAVLRVEGKNIETDIITL